MTKKKPFKKGDFDDDCPRCGSMQIEQTMHRGYNYLECVNCGALMDYDGKLEGDSE